MKTKVEAARRKIEEAMRELEAVQKTLPVESPELKRCLYNLNEERERLEGLLELAEALA